MKRDEREELFTAYALGTLSAPDAAEVEALVSSDETAAEELAAYRDIADLIALSVPMRAVDPTLRDQVLRAARSERRMRRLPRLRLPGFAPAAAMAAALVLLVVWVVQLQSSVDELRDSNAQLTAIVEADAKRLEALVQADADESRSLGLQLATALQEQQLLTAVQSDPDAVVIELEGTNQGHGSGGRYLWSTGAGAGVILAHDLPPLPFTAVYRVWLEDRFGRMVAGGTFTPDEFGSAQALVRPEDTSDRVRRVYVEATSDPTSPGIAGPLVLEGVIEQNR